MYTGLSGYGGILSLYIQYGHTQKVDSMSSFCDVSLTDTLYLHICTHVLTSIRMYARTYIFTNMNICMYVNILT